MAEQYLGIAGGIQAELNVKCCYEAYTAFAAASVLDNKLKEAEMDSSFYEIVNAFGFYIVRDGIGRCESRG